MNLYRWISKVAGPFGGKFLQGTQEVLDLANTGGSERPRSGWGLFRGYF